MNSLTDQPPAKRKRLSYACNYCREKKTRCDEEQPCRNCRVAGVECVTTDKRRDGALVEHRRRDTYENISVPAAPNAQTPRPGAVMYPAQQACTPRTPQSHSPSAIPTAAQERPRLWSQCWGPEGWKTGRRPMMPRFVGSSMLELMTEWLDMAFYRLKGPKAHAVSPVVNPDFASTILAHPPHLPPPAELQLYIESYWNTLHRIFPFLDRVVVDSLYDKDSHTVQNPVPHSAANTPTQALQYLIVTAGLLTMPADESCRSLISSYISYCNSLLGYIVSNRCLQSVQAILLFAMVLRSCDKTAWAWDILAMGVSMAQSIGINQISSAQKDSSTPDTPEFRIWWCMYVFERLLSLECGRPSLIWDRQLSETLASAIQVDQDNDKELQFRNSLISLANMLHEMQELSARAWRREEWIPQSVEQAIEDKLRTGGELQILLSEWQDSVPSAYRPGSSSALDPSSGPQSAFLSYYYNLGVILVNRSTLLVPKDELHSVVNKHAAGQAWRQRLLSGPTLVIEAARQTIKLFVALIDSGTPNYLTTITSPLAAVYALAVHIFQERKSLLIRSDFELIKVGIQITNEHYHRHGTVENVYDILLDLEEYASRCLEVPASQAGLSGIQDNIILNDLPLEETIPTFESGSNWGPAALDWAGWDWNDLSHLFAHSE
ncbi:hypothetical protein N7454_000395 [Penicillium verhagenii]|nr:hypothetical protein N7454_000395 [Penicillium verhagenii]